MCYLQTGRPVLLQVETYNKSCSQLQSLAPSSGNISRVPSPATSTPALPLHVGEEDNTAAVGPSEIDDESPDEFDFLTLHSACSAQH